MVEPIIRYITKNKNYIDNYNTIIYTKNREEKMLLKEASLN